MEWNGLLGMIYGLVSGLFEFLPASPQVHQEAFLMLTGVDLPGSGMALAVHLGALASVIMSHRSTISKLARERRIAGQPKRNRKRSPNAVCLMQLRLLRIASIPVILSSLAAPWISQSIGRLWVIAILTVLSGIVVLLPHYMTRANKDARTLSPLDATLIGFGGVLGALPGFSRVGTLTAISSMRGADRQFGLEFTYLLTIPALAVACITDVGMLIFAGDALAGTLFLPGVLACIAAFGAGLTGIRLMRLLAEKSGYESLAYYNWGLAMFIMILYIIG